jgi:hypothetical protein
VTLKPFGLEELLLKPDAGGISPSGVIQPGPPALGPSTFLLDPGGQDYVGNNSYDDASRMD